MDSWGRCKASRRCSRSVVCAVPECSGTDTAGGRAVLPSFLPGPCIAKRTRAVPSPCLVRR